MNKKKSNFRPVRFCFSCCRQCRRRGKPVAFPYLAAKDGGGLFLVIYLALVLTFGFTLLASDIAIGRRTKKALSGLYPDVA